MRAHVIGALFLSLSLASCRGRTASPGDLADRPLAYEVGSSWACRPGRADACAGERRPSRQHEQHRVTAAPGRDATSAESVAHAGFWVTCPRAARSRGG